MTEPKVYRAKLTDFTPDNKNANKHTVRGIAMIEDSISKDGAGRGLLADKHGKLIAGNATTQALVDAGMLEAIVVETTGNQIVITKRVDVDLDTAKGRRLAISDNRAAEVSLSWDADVLADFASEGIELGAFFDPSELTDLGVTTPIFEPVSVDEQGRLDQKSPVTCPHCRMEFIPRG